MRDGVELSVDVYLPGEEGSYPAVLIATPYDNTMKSHVDMARFFVSHGYAFVVEDVRGRYDSGGVWRPFLQEGRDGYDTVEWMAEQPWCDGKIGMMGGSYRGWVQWATARLGPPHLTTMVPTATGGNYMREFPFFWGIPALWILAWLNFVGGRTCQNVASPTIDWERVFRTLPLEAMPEALGRDLPIWKEWLSHPNVDDYWRRVIFTEEDFRGIDLPVLHITGWYDGDQPGALFYYENMVEHSPAGERQYLLVGPWDHAGTRNPQRTLRGVDFTAEAVMEMAEIHLKWFDRWLKGSKNEVDLWPKTRYFVMGENRWAGEDGPWPPEGAEPVRYYLHSGGAANTLWGDGSLSLEKPGDEAADEYVYNPEHPVVTTMTFDFYGEKAETPLDNRYVLRRDDVLVYTSEPLGDRVLVCGRPIVELYASSNCRDTDWFATLSDVHPDGRSISVSQGALRARYRNSLERPELMRTGEVYRFRIQLYSTCIAFQPGHRIRLAVTSSDFPRYARNTNTGNDVATDTEIKIARNMVHHNERHPSNILLPEKKL
ncbi:MAG: CocE/NonD family hydrolase [Candidatus Bathyarchaeia archaeon]